ncbi:MAG: dTDP-glucose 4,6-dehydratase, partial [Bacteroidota bacterium]
AEGRIRNAKIRELGTKNLIAAAVKAGVRRVIAQSIAFMYESSPKPFIESLPLASEGLRMFENQILQSGMEGIVLRYGRFYGPRTGFSVSPGVCAVHVDAAAYAALLAILGGAGIYNIAEEDGEVSIAKAVKELKWDPSFRI